jgi:hypothetical protein
MNLILIVLILLLLFGGGGGYYYGGPMVGGRHRRTLAYCPRCLFAHGEAGTLDPETHTGGFIINGLVVRVPNERPGPGKYSRLPQVDPG